MLVGPVWSQVVSGGRVTPAFRPIFVFSPR
jgi:hypothetical protein